MDTKRDPSVEGSVVRRQSGEQLIKDKARTAIL
jgi:hypothetical protein